VAGLPLVALGGYLLNRRLGIHPGEILEGYALPRNLIYLAACAALALAASWLAHRRLTRGGGPGSGSRRRGSRAMARPGARPGRVEPHRQARRAA
jgi:hypothetical protein